MGCTGCRIVVVPADAVHGDRVLRLVLADTYAGWAGSFPPSVVAKRVARCEHDSHLPPEEFLPRWIPEMLLGFRLMAKSLADTDTTDLLPRIGVRTLILWGESDERSPLSIAEQLRDAIPRAELCVLAHVGHVSNMEQPAEYNAQVRRFCSTV